MEAFAGNAGEMAPGGRVCVAVVGLEVKRLCASVNERVVTLHLWSRSQQLVKPFPNRTETREAVRSSADAAEGRRCSNYGNG